ncbi:hypothetical protein VTI74DRAFT_8353 [Chaetomium olivicolor]
MEMTQHQVSASSSRQMCNRTQTHQSQEHLWDYEDGIADNIDLILIDRKGERKISTWTGLWGVLFPDDDHILPSGSYLFLLTHPLSEACHADRWLDSVRTSHHHGTGRVHQACRGGIASDDWKYSTNARYRPGPGRRNRFLIQGGSHRVPPQVPTDDLPERIPNPCDGTSQLESRCEDKSSQE